MITIIIMIGSGSSPSYIGVLLVALVGLRQALPGLLAAGGGGVRLHHLLGAVPEPALPAVRLVQLLYLQPEQEEEQEGKTMNDRFRFGGHTGRGSDPSLQSAQTEFVCRAAKS